jgi:hypothetical protein
LLSESRSSTSEESSGRLKFPWEFVWSDQEGYPAVDVALDDNRINVLGKRVCVRYAPQMRDFDANHQANLDYHYLKLFFHLPPRTKYATRADAARWIYLDARDQDC